MAADDKNTRDPNAAVSQIALFPVHDGYLISEC